MIQVWLVLVAIFLWQTSRDSRKLEVSAALGMLAFGVVIMSVILFFVNGGTTG